MLVTLLLFYFDITCIYVVFWSRYVKDLKLLFSFKICWSYQPISSRNPGAIADSTIMACSYVTYLSNLLIYNIENVANHTLVPAIKDGSFDDKLWSVFYLWQSIYQAEYIWEKNIFTIAIIASIITSIFQSLDLSKHALITAKQTLRVKRVKHVSVYMYM